MILQGARLWLVRHGVTDWNVQGRVQGQTPTELNEEGYREAERVARFFAGRSGRIAAVWSSDLPRAAQTAKVIAQRMGLPVELSEPLRERAFGPYEGMTSGELSAARTALGLPQTGDLADWTGLRDVESEESVWTRASAELRRISERHGGEDVVVVTHGGVIARVLYRVLGIVAGAPRRFPLANGMVVVLQWRVDAFYILSLLDLGLVLESRPTVDTATMNRLRESGPAA